MQYCRLCRCHSGRDRVVRGAVRGGRKSDRYGRLAVSSGAQNSSLGAETPRAAPSTDERLTLDGWTLLETNTAVFEFGLAAELGHLPYQWQLCRAIPPEFFFSNLMSKSVNLEHFGSHFNLLGRWPLAG